MADELSKLFNSLPPEEQEEMLNGPGLEPPKGVIPNFENPPNQTELAHISLVLCIVFCAVFVVLAAWTKIIRTKVVRVEDGFALVALISWCVFVGFLYEAVRKYGYFINQWDFPMREATNYLRYFWVVTLAYFVTIAFIKVAIVFQWIHLFVPHHRRNAFWWTCQIIGWVNWLACIIMMFLVAFGCKPIAKFWNPLLEGTCVDTIPTIYVAPIINLVFDIIALILPQKVIWGLQLSLQKKLGVSVLFALGILACISAAMRIPASLTFSREMNHTYNIAPTELWCLAEMSVGILIYCMPSAPAGVKRVKDKAKESTQRMRGYSSSAASQSKSRKSKGSTGHMSSSGHQSITGHPPIPGPYRQLDEIPLTGMPATTTTAAAFSDAPEMDYGRNVGLSRSDSRGITRTTNVTVSSAARGGSRDPFSSQQL